MIRNRISKGLSLISFDRLPWKKSLPAGHELLEGATFLNRFAPKRPDEASKVEFWVDEGVVEIRDSRLFRAGQESFCTALAEAMARPGSAQRVEIRLGTATCRIEFDPGRLGRDDLADRVAKALKAASLASTARPSGSARDLHPARWITLTAIASAGEPSIWETLIDEEGQVVSRPRAATRTSRISTYSRRPLRALPRRARSNPPRARAAIVPAARPPVEPIALALSPRSIFGKFKTTLALHSSAESRRLVHMGLAGGSFAMTIAGVVLPGIPALPFLLLTGHYLVKSSPELCQRLENVPGIGALLAKAGEVGGQVIDRRSLWKMFGLTVAAVTAFAILHPPLPVVILLETGMMAYYGLREFRKPARISITARFGTGMARLA